VSTVGDTARTVLTPVHRHFRLNRWSLFALAIAAMVAIPIIVVLSFVFAPASDVWHHLASTVLTRYIANALWLVVGVSFTTLVTGVGAAWLVTMCRFPSRRIFEWALLLPMAVPAYAIAYTYARMLDFAGPVQTFLRDFLVGHATTTGSRKYAPWAVLS